MIGQFLATLFRWPNGILVGNLLATALLAIPAIVQLHLKMARHHAAHLAALARHHAEQLMLLRQHHEEHLVTLQQHHEEHLVTLQQHHEAQIAVIRQEAPRDTERSPQAGVS